jgi:tetratricopeptide (TPR) repeat protein/predicted MPP superfamily phosphohydrolase
MSRKYRESKASMTSISWLHLTDLHFNTNPSSVMAGQRWLWPNVREEFFTDLRRVYEHTGPWDLVFFSGDLAQSGTKDDYEALDRVLTQLWTEFDHLGCDPVLLAVPGNHDLRWPDQNVGTVRAMKSWCSDRELRQIFWADDANEYRALIRDVFEPYTGWWDRRRAQTNLPWRTGLLPGDFSVSYEKAGIKLGIVGLNSAFMQLGKGVQEGQLLDVDPRQVHEVCGGDAVEWTKGHYVNVLMTHHPLEWLNLEARKKFQTEIAPGERFLMHMFGHNHEADFNVSRRGGGGTKRELQGASLFGLESYETPEGGLEHRIHGYTAGRLEFADGQSTLLLWPRKLIQLKGGELRMGPDQEQGVDGRGAIADALRLKAYPERPLGLVDQEQRIERLLVTVEEIHNKVNSELKKHRLDRVAYSIIPSIKPLPLIRDEILRTRVQPEDIPDLSRFRIITYFQSGMVDAVESLISLIAGTQAEFIDMAFYDSRRASDPLSILPRLREFAATRNLRLNLLPADTTSYSWIKLVVGFEQTQARGLERTPIIVKVEFQICCVFEEVWGQLSQILSFGKGRANPGPREWGLHLGVLKTMIDGFIQYAELIKDQSGIDLMLAEAAQELPKPTQPVNEVISKLPPLPEAILNKFIAAATLSTDASLADEASSGQKFTDAAESFATVISEILADVSISPDVKKRAIDAAKMERAYCLLFSKDDKNVDKAISLYDEFAKEHKEDAVCRFRYGQALRRKKQTQKAVTLFKECIDLLDTNTTKNGGERNWIHSVAHRELGYTYWLISDEIPEQKQKYLADAISETRQALAKLLESDLDGLNKCTNNFVFYGWEERNLQVKNLSITDDELMKYLDILLQHDQELETNAIDTICRALDYFNKTDRAAQVAAKVAELLSQTARTRAGATANQRLDARSLQRHLTNEELDAYVFATTLITDHLGKKVSRREG